jgi:hypothetical protein
LGARYLAIVAFLDETHEDLLEAIHLVTHAQDLDAER